MIIMAKRRDSLRPTNERFENEWNRMGIFLLLKKNTGSLSVRCKRRRRDETGTWIRNESELKIPMVILSCACITHAITILSISLLLLHIVSLFIWIISFAIFVLIQQINSIFFLTLKHTKQKTNQQKLIGWKLESLKKLLF